VHGAGGEGTRRYHSPEKDPPPHWASSASTNGSRGLGLEEGYGGRKGGREGGRAGGREGGRRAGIEMGEGGQN